MPPHCCQPGSTTVLAEEEGAKLWASPPSQQGWAEGLQLAIVPKCFELSVGAGCSALSSGSLVLLVALGAVLPLSHQNKWKSGAVFTIFSAAFGGVCLVLCCLHLCWWCCGEGRGHHGDAVASLHVQDGRTSRKACLRQALCEGTRLGSPAWCDSREQFSCARPPGRACKS